MSSDTPRVRLSERQFDCLRLVSTGLSSPEIARMLTLTCDHRVVDGTVGSRWLRAFKTLLEEPLTMIV